MITSRWLTAAQVAELLHVRNETVRRWIRNGDIPVLEIGGPRMVYRIRAVDLANFVHERYPGSDLPDALAELLTPALPANGPDGEPVASDDAGPGADPVAIIDQGPAIVFRERPDIPGAAAQLSREIEQLLGYPAESLINRADDWLRFVHPDDLEDVTAELERTDATGEPYRMDYRMINSDGESVWVRVEAERVPSEGTDEQVWEGVIIDITRLKELEASLKRRELQQWSVSELGRIALESSSLAPILRHAAMFASQSLEADHVLVYEVLPGGRGLAVRVRVDRDERDGGIRQGSIEEQPAYAMAETVLGTREPVVMTDTGAEDRFETESLAALGVTSAVGITIPGRARPFGAIVVMSRSGQTFVSGDLMYLHSLANVVGSAVATSDEHWMTVTEVAEYLQVTEETVRRWIRRSDLPALHLGGARAGYRVYPSDLERFIQRRVIRLQSDR